MNPTARYNHLIRYSQTVKRTFLTWLLGVTIAGVALGVWVALGWVVVCVVTGRCG